MGIQQGCLLLADISGYTRYLSGVELDHSQDILADVIGVVVEHLRGGGFELAKLEGDAVFCYVPDAGSTAEGRTLLTLVEGTYVAFQSRLRDIRFATTCGCDACRAIPNLDLKFAVHHGEFVLHEVVGQRELLGSDVVLAHRLLKNQVGDLTGLRGYALFTRSCVERFAIDTTAAAMVEHRESYEDVGDVDGFVLDLERRWKDEQDREALYIGSAQAAVEVSASIPAPPPTAWDWITSPSKRMLWQLDTERVDEVNPSGLPGVGTRNHCVHGPGRVVTELVLDWKPFRYFTARSNGPLGGFLQTVEFEPEDYGSATGVVFRMLPEGTTEQRAALLAAEPYLREFLETGLARISELMAAPELA